MKRHLPTIVAYVLLALSLTAAFIITTSQAPSQNKTGVKDVEIIIKKSEQAKTEELSLKNQAIFVEVNSLLKQKLGDYRKYAFAVIDSYEIEIGDYWREVLNKFEYFEYYKAFPEAFIRRMIFMPTFTGNKELSDVDEEEKPVVYPDYDYRSIRYRVSLVPDTIECLKKIVNFFYFRIKICLIF